MKKPFLLIFAVTNMLAQPIVIDDFSEGSRHFSVEAPDQGVTNTAMGLSTTYGGQRQITLQAQAGFPGSITLDITNGKAALRNSTNTQAMVAFQYNVAGLALSSNSFIRVSGTDAPSDFDAWFTDAQGREFEKGGDQNSWISLADAYSTPNAPRPDWNTIRTLRVFQGGPIGTTWDITYIEIITMLSPPVMTIRAPEPEVCWTSESNRNYRVQYQSNLTTNRWQDLGSPIQATGTNTCVRDAAGLGEPRRFYRVVVFP